MLPGKTNAIQLQQMCIPSTIADYKSELH